MGCNQSQPDDGDNSAPIDLYYWGVASRGHYPLFVAAGANKMGRVKWHTQHPYPGTEEWETHPTKSITGQLPYMVDTNTGAKMGQSMAMCRYLARQFRMYDGCSEADFAVSEQMIDVGADLHAILSKAHYAPDGNRTKAMDAILVDKANPKGIHRQLAAAESQLSPSGFFGAELLPGDCVYAAVLDILLRLEPKILEGSYPKSAALYTRFKLMPGVQELLAMPMGEYFKRHTDPKK